MIVVVGLFVTVGVWDFTNQVRSEKILAGTHHEADQIRTSLANYFSSQLAFGLRVSSMIHELTPESPEYFRQYWQGIFRENPGITGVELIDGETQEPIWTEVPLEKDVSTLNKLFQSRIAASREWKELTETAAQKNHIAVSASLDHSLAYAVYPVFNSSWGPIGFLVQYFEIKPFLSQFFSDKNIVSYHYLISQHWNVLYSDLKYWKEINAPRPFKVMRQIPMGNQDWFLNIWPKEEYLTGEIQYEITGMLILTMGILLSIASGLFAWSLVSRKETLEKLVKIRTEELETVNGELKSKNEEMESFIYAVSHDLKSPLVSIKGFTSLLNRDLRSKMNEEEQHAIDRINANTSQMHAMILDLLELSRVGRVDTTESEIEVKDIVKDILDELKPVLDQKHVLVEMNGALPRLQTSAPRLRQLFSNLIGNAVKYMGSQSQPRIEIGVNENEPTFYQFHVRDNGMGIAQDYQDRIFRVFERGPQHNGTEGTGVGLAIVKKIVETAGGKIWLESEVGKGSTFYFTLPRK